MARQLRQDPPGGWHHITNRGARRYDTFIDDEDRASFLDYVIKACDRFGARLVSYCLMANHYHLVMHCPDGQVSSIVQTYAANYTRTFNRDHGFDGRLHSARFHNTLLTSLEHAVVATRYGHRNPIEVRYDAISFPWSSLGIFAGERPTGGSAPNTPAASTVSATQ